jgi:hypothetical protein
MRSVTARQSTLLIFLYLFLTDFTSISYTRWSRNILSTSSSTYSALEPIHDSVALTLLSSSSIRIRRETIHDIVSLILSNTIKKKGFFLEKRLFTFNTFYYFRCFSTSVKLLSYYCFGFRNSISYKCHIWPSTFILIWC